MSFLLFLTVISPPQRVHRASRLVLGLILLSTGSFGCTAQSGGTDQLFSARQVYLVRHTEREAEGEDPPLTARGEARAQALAATLRDAGITAIITTQWKRTRDSAKPLAAILKITPEIVPVYEGKAAENSRAVAEAVRRYKDQIVLVIGHITVTGVISALGGPSLPTICDDVFSDLFQLTPALGERGLVHLHYGAEENISPNCRLTAPLRERFE
jgi:phosphohistidine phosphatase SixA